MTKLEQFAAAALTGILAADGPIADVWKIAHEMMILPDPTPSHKWKPGDRLMTVRRIGNWDIRSTFVVEKVDQDKVYMVSEDTGAELDFQIGGPFSTKITLIK